jgi:hypothetical protein
MLPPIEKTHRVVGCFQKTSIVPLKVYEIFYIKAKNGRKEAMAEGLIR